MRARPAGARCLRLSRQTCLRPLISTKSSASQGSGTDPCPTAATAAATVGGGMAQALVFSLPVPSGEARGLPAARVQPCSHVRRGSCAARAAAAPGGGGTSSELGEAWRRVRPPHSGYHFDGTPRRFFEVQWEADLAVWRLIELSKLLLTGQHLLACPATRRPALAQPAWVGPQAVLLQGLAALLAHLTGTACTHTTGLVLQGHSAG